MLNIGNIVGRTYVGGFLGDALINSLLYINNSINYSEVYGYGDIGGFVGKLPNLNDSDKSFYAGLIKNYQQQIVIGTNFGTKVTDISTLNLAFFTTTLEWDTEIWDFTGLDIANGVYPTLKNMPEIPVEE